RFVYAKAQMFLKEIEKNTDGVKWFYFGGQVGCGKTHICTAIVGELLTKQNKPTLYMQWREDVTNLKANVMNAYEYEGKMKAFKTVDVLYIDDLFKTEKGKTPTTADINIAFEILNYRYNQNDLITVISSEKTAFELLEVDEAVASRIIENAGEFRIDVKNDKTKNFRLRNLFNGGNKNV
ncbi:MAG: ATP-binding protein, partial [Clostridia bacterium]|nr:ATP-binding protein [Clostridia bacterium]